MANTNFILQIDLEGSAAGRNFSEKIKDQEFTACRGHCRICKKKTIEGQFAHIYSNTLNERWKRAGTRYRLWYNDDFVRSVENCLYLCIPCHQKIDTEEGRTTCSVGMLRNYKRRAMITEKEDKYNRNFSNENEQFPPIGKKNNIMKAPINKKDQCIATTNTEHRCTRISKRNGLCQQHFKQLIKTLV